MTVGTLFNRTLVVLNMLLDRATVVEESFDIVTVAGLLFDGTMIALDMLPN